MNGVSARETGERKRVTNMCERVYTGHRRRLAWLLFLVASVATRQPAVNAQTWQSIGHFTSGAFAGSVFLADRDTALLVDVNVEIPNPRRAVPSEAVRAWILLEDSKVALLRTKEPSDGREPFATCLSGSCQAHVMFTFDKTVKPLALVLAFEEHIELFPLPGGGLSK